LQQKESLKHVEFRNLIIEDIVDLRNIHNDFYFIRNLEKIIETLQNYEQLGVSELNFIEKQNKKTLILTHNMCFKHGYISDNNPIKKIIHRRTTPENPDRLTVLLQPPFGILLSDYFIKNCIFKDNANHATLSDVLRIHDYKYVKSFKNVCDEFKSKNITHVNQYGNYNYKNNTYLDRDTTISADTYEAAIYAVGSVMEAVDQIMNGEVSNAFVAIRPPGHHAGHFGKVE
jgi:hypothetical protein